jgi:hypothetical protein
MTFLDAVKIATAILFSLGGAGGIVLGLSSYLGKLWADRALEKQRHEYAQLTQQTQHQLDAALKRVQMELDTLGLVHNLRTKEEFNRLAELWKRFANLRDAFGILSIAEPLPLPGHEESYTKLKAKRLEDFINALYDTRQFFYEVQVFIPEPITTVVADTLSSAVKVHALLGDTPGPRLSVDVQEDATKRAFDDFLDGHAHLEQLIRKHIRGESLGRN